MVLSVERHRVEPKAREQADRPSGTMSVRLAAVAGAVTFGLILVFGTLTSGTPSANDPARDTFDYLSLHHGRLQLAAVVMGFAMPAALLFLSGLFRALRKAEGGTPGLALAALGGGVLAAASTVTGALIVGTVATRIDDLGVDGARVGWTMFLLSLGASLLGLLLLIGVTGVMSLQAHVFARWFGGASILLALLSAIGAVTVGYDTNALQVVAGIAVILDSVWILLVSLFLWREPALAVPQSE